MRSKLEKMYYVVVFFDRYGEISDIVTTTREPRENKRQRIAGAYRSYQAANRRVERIDLHYA